MFAAVPRLAPTPILVRDPAIVSHPPEAMSACPIHIFANAGKASHQVAAVANITTAIVHIMIHALRARLHATFKFSSEKFIKPSHHLTSCQRISLNKRRVSISTSLTPMSSRVHTKSGGIYIDLPAYVSESKFRSYASRTASYASLVISCHNSTIYCWTSLESISDSVSGLKSHSSIFFMRRASIEICLL
jgi:hypothetical protein